MAGENEIAGVSGKGIEEAEKKQAEAEKREAEAEERSASAQEKGVKTQSQFFKGVQKGLSGLADKGKDVGSSLNEHVEKGISLASMILIFGGVANYVLKLYFKSSILNPGFSMFVVVSVLLFIVAGYALAERLKRDRLAILIPMLIFFIWYFVLQSTYDPSTLLYMLLVFASLSLIFAIFSKGGSVKPELLGLLPVLFFFLDLGMIPFLVGKLSLPVTPLLQNLILYMPWWALFGLLTLPAEASKDNTLNFLINIVRILGIFYIVFILLAPALPNIGYDKSLLPSPGELEEAQARMRERLPPENLAWSNLICVFEDVSNIQVCVKKRQEDSKLKEICKKKGYVETDSYFDECMNEERAKMNKGLDVSGVTDQAIPTKAKFVTTEYFPKTSYRKSSEDLKTTYAVEFNVENPRKTRISAEFSCSFKQGNNVVPGMVRVNEKNENNQLSVEFTEEYGAAIVTCEPLDKNMSGSYTLTYEARLSGLKTVSKLNRAFFSGNAVLDKKELINDIKKTHFSGSSSHLSQAPADFARINFGFGNTVSNPIIDVTVNSVLSSMVENAGSGKILAVKSYNVKLDGFDASVNRGEKSCLYGENVNLPTDEKSFLEVVNLPTCVITDYPSELKNLGENYKFRGFEAELEYDYLVKKEINLNVQVLG